MKRNLRKLLSAAVLAGGIAGWPAASPASPAGKRTLDYPPVENFQVELQGSSAVLTWEPPLMDIDADSALDIAVESYEIRSSGVEIVDQAAWDDAAILYNGIPDPGSSAQTWTSDPLPSGTHHFMVRAWYGGITTELYDPPPPPVIIGGAVPAVTGLAVVAGSATTSSLQLAWNPPAGGATQVRIYYSTSSSTPPATEATPDWIPGTPPLATVTLPSAGTTFYFAVKARISPGVESPMSGEPYPSGATLSAGGGPAASGGGSGSGGFCGASTAGAGGCLLAVLLLAARRR